MNIAGSLCSCLLLLRLGGAPAFVVPQHPFATARVTLPTTTSLLLASKVIEETQLKKQSNPWKKHDADLMHRAYGSKHVPESAHHKESTDYDYIIIGSGIGGLWLAACLAKFGQKSLVLEHSMR